MAKKAENSWMMTIVVGVVTTVLGAALVALYASHETNVKAIATLETKVSALEKQVSFMWEMDYGKGNK